MTRNGAQAGLPGRRGGLSLIILIGLLASACGSSTQIVSSPTPSRSLLASSPAAPLSATGKVAHLTVAGTDVTGPAIRLTADLPASWDEHGPYAANRVTAHPPAGVSFFASLIDNMFKDPCLHVERLPRLGPTVEEAAKALAEIPGITATTARRTTIAGHEATYVELTMPDPLPCATPNLWQDSPGGDWFALGPSELIRVWILEVDGRRVAIAGRSHPGTSVEAKAELDAILGSIRFESA